MYKWTGRRKSPCNKGADADAAAAEGASPSPEAAASVFQQFADFIDSKVSSLEPQCPCHSSASYHKLPSYTADNEVHSEHTNYNSLLNLAAPSIQLQREYSWQGFPANTCIERLEILHWRTISNNDCAAPQAAALEVGLYQMPGTSGEVPAIFLDDAPDAEADVGEVQEHVFSEPEHCLSDEEAIVLD